MWPEQRSQPRDARISAKLSIRRYRPSRRPKCRRWKVRASGIHRHFPAHRPERCNTAKSITPAFLLSSGRRKTSPNARIDITVEVVASDTASWNGSRGVCKTVRRGARIVGESRVRGRRINPGDLAQSIEHPERIADYGWRAPHAMNVAARALVPPITENSRSASSRPAPAGRSGCQRPGASPKLRRGRCDEPHGIRGAARHTFGDVDVYTRPIKEPGRAWSPTRKGRRNPPCRAQACDANDGLKNGNHLNECPGLQVRPRRPAVPGRRPGRSL